MRDQYGESLSETTSDAVRPERVDPRLHYGWYEDDRSAAGTRGEASSGGSEASPGHPAASEARPGSEVLGDAPQEGGPLPGGELETADPTKPRPLHQDEVEPGEAAAPSGDQVAPWSPGEEAGAPAGDKPPETQPPASGRTPEPRTAEWQGRGDTDAVGHPHSDPRSHYVRDESDPFTDAGTKTADPAEGLENAGARSGQASVAEPGAGGSSHDHSSDAELGTPDDAASARTASAHEPHTGPENFKQFLSDAEGEAYGESRLGHVFRDLPSQVRDAVYRYASNHKYGLMIRDYVRDPGRMVQWFDDLQFGHRQVKWLTALNDGEMPSIAKLEELSSRPSGLTDYDRRLIQSILDSENPSAFLCLVEDLDCECAKMEFLFGGGTIDAFLRYVEHLDEATRHLLPEPIEAIRGLDDVKWMVDGQGVRLGDRNPQILEGTVQTSPGPMSSSLGVTPGTKAGIHSFLLHLRLPEGAQGIWLGRQVDFPHERELLLPRGTRYRIIKVVRALEREASAPPGFEGSIYDIWAEVIPPERPGHHLETGGRAAG
ncbi:ADP-ribosyltransferase [Actinomadura physcomitrii]|nr:ADP-ribosyltransferase [Actinomadura physcomitrii]